MPLGEMRGKTMDEYILRENAIKAIIDLPNCPNGYSDTYDKECIIGILEEVTSADVVEVVRCKDCIHHKNAPKTTDVWCDMLDGLLPKDWFCADGERRE